MTEKKFIEQFKGDTVNDIIEIRLHMRDPKKNYRKGEEQHCTQYVRQRMTQQSRCFNVEEMKIKNGETSKIILNENGWK